MSRSLSLADCVSPVFRIGRHPDAWSFVDWARAGDEGTFGNRWDDAAGLYRVLYASSQRVGALVETLSAFRANPALESELAIIGDSKRPTAGRVPPEWAKARLMGRADLNGAFADISSSESIAVLRTELHDAAREYGVVDIDAAALKDAAPRRFTQAVSRFVYESEEAGVMAGIYYRSRHGDDLDCWAVFERSGSTPLTDCQSEVLYISDPDIARAFELLGLQWDSDSA